MDLTDWKKRRLTGKTLRGLMIRLPSKPKTKATLRWKQRRGSAWLFTSGFRASEQREGKNRFADYGVARCVVVAGALAANFPVYTTFLVGITLRSMELGDQDIKEFQEIWRNAFHEEIPLEEARAIAADVMRLYSLLGQPREQGSLLDSD